jgi:hypothetical protein
MKDLDRLINALVQEAESIDLTYSSTHDHRASNYSSSKTSTTPSSAQQTNRVFEDQLGSTVASNHSRSRNEYIRREPDFSNIPQFETLNSRRAQPEDSFYQYQTIDSSPVGRMSRSISHQPHSASPFLNHSRNDSQDFSRDLQRDLSYDAMLSEVRGGARLRSQSADGSRESERGENPDEWLARQMKKLKQKKATTTTRYCI